jgi:hypothetical protein
VFNVSVDAGGILGYKKLTGTLKSNGNSITVKLDIELPDRLELIFDFPGQRKRTEPR